MAIVSPLEEKNHRSSKCLQFFPLMETSYVADQTSQKFCTDLSHMVDENTAAAMQETYPINKEAICLDIDFEEKHFGKPKEEDEALGISKIDYPGNVQRQASLKACVKLMDIVGAPILSLICRGKSLNECSNRWRKCKRAALYDWRRVVLFCSILSSAGTMVLIYLTLRIPQAAESFVSA